MSKNQLVKCINCQLPETYETIEFDKAGHSEWVSDMDMATLEAEVEKTIAGMRFHIKPLAAPMPLLLSELDSVLGDQYGSLM